MVPGLRNHSLHESYLILREILFVELLNGENAWEGVL